ncbi:hypothetical protein SAMN06264364_103190 [Quadrisphaera granulorum]|uniref:Uncharacterized protein n=1 Tax=Quadrisphaera granulorum TaxID=317664 RepID=A0A316ACN4_9ACTN|nr:DUF6518 family protein [Quadrisphaera granulorum]PWJ55515.1 hypothetical protein BXY45_103190 [Quadrisphaera granulorum]SZE95579.1 hypothetical protein SAMN06264364_103190 [Quadrisphaera granulorum]
MSAAAHAAPFRRPAPASRPPRRHTSATTAAAVAAVIASTVAAVLLGAATEAAQGVLPTAWGPLANSITAWVLLPAALTTAVLAAVPRQGTNGLTLALAAGLASTQGLVAGYYGWAAVVSNTSHAWSSVVLWAAAGLVSGALVGVAALVRATERGPLRGAATGLLAAVPLADGGRTVLLFPWQAAAGWAFAALAVVVLLVGLRRGERTAGWMTAAAAVAAGAGGFALLDAAARIAGGL